MIINMQLTHSDIDRVVQRVWKEVENEVNKKELNDQWKEFIIKSIEENCKEYFDNLRKDVQLLVKEEVKIARAKKL